MQVYFILESSGHLQTYIPRHVLSFQNRLRVTAPRCANDTPFAFQHKLTDISIKIFQKKILLSIFMCLLIHIIS